MTSLIRFLFLCLIAGSAFAQSSLPPCRGDASSWTNCLGGKTYASGYKYFGQYKDGKRNGKGTSTFAYGQYVGEFKADKPHGQGIAYWEDGDIACSGNWLNGKFINSFVLDSKKFPFNSHLQTAPPSSAEINLAAALNSQPLQGQSWRERFERVVQAELQQWLTADASGHEEIPPPVYPAARTLKQEVWETNNEFEVRVEAARSERRSTIEGLQADYRAKVEQRNMRVGDCNKTRQYREAGLAKRREILIKTGLAILTPPVTLSNVAFDQQLGLLTISTQIDGLGLQVFAFNDAPQAFRRSALTYAGTMKAIPQFQVSETGDLFLRALSVEVGGTTAQGTPSVGVASPLQLASVILPAQAPDFVSLPPVSELVPVFVDGNKVMVDPAEKLDYDKAMALFRQANFWAAQRALESFVLRHGTSAYVPSALFWLGNAQYANEAYMESMGNFQKLLSMAPQHPRAAEAMLAISNVHIELKDMNSARRTLQDLIAAYPRDDTAVVARQRLNRLQ